MAITRADVEKVSLLARLLLSEPELEKLTGELSQIVNYVDQLGQVDTDDIEPMVHAVEVSNVFAEDVIRPSLPREEALATAPQHNDRAYLVPPVLGG